MSKDGMGTRSLGARLLHDGQRAQLTVASIAAILVIVAAIVALPRSDDRDVVPNARTATDPPITFAEDTLGGGARDDVAVAGDGASSARARASRATVDGKSAYLPAVNKRILKVGITYTEDPDGAEASAGTEGGAFIDERRGWEAVVRDVNEHLPFGRKIVPVWYSLSENEAGSGAFERLEQEACARFTQDNRVDFVWTGTLGSGNEILSTCLTKAKVPQIAFWSGLSSRSTFERHPYLIEPASAALDRLADFYVAELAHAKFFTSFKDNEQPYGPAKPTDGRARIGLIRYDTPGHKDAATALKRRLASHGLKLCSGCEFEVAYSGTNLREQLDDSSEVNAAIQACKGSPDGPCTHVLLLGAASQRIPVFFMDGAERQAYRPRIAFSPLDSWTFAHTFIGGKSTEAQFARSLLVTWNPFDLGQTVAPFVRCKKLFTDAGEEFSRDRTGDKDRQITPLCDTGSYFTAVMKKVGRILDLPSWTRAVRSLPLLDAAGAYGMRTTSGRRDGIGAVRVGTWFDSCTCFKPVSHVRTV